MFMRVALRNEPACDGEHLSTCHCSGSCMLYGYVCCCVCRISPSSVLTCVLLVCGCMGMWAAVFAEFHRARCLHVCFLCASLTSAFACRVRALGQPSQHAAPGAIDALLQLANAWHSRSARLAHRRLARASTATSTCADLDLQLAALGRFGRHATRLVQVTADLSKTMLQMQLATSQLAS